MEQLGDGRALVTWRVKSPLRDATAGFHEIAGHCAVILSNYGVSLAMA